MALIALVAVLLLRHPPTPKTDGGPITRRWRNSGESRRSHLMMNGPIPDFTPAILSALDVSQVKATFFMIGEQMENNPRS